MLLPDQQTVLLLPQRLAHWQLMMSGDLMLLLHLPLVLLS
jgi:hypothetical protein